MEKHECDCELLDAGIPRVADATRGMGIYAFFSKKQNATRKYKKKQCNSAKNHSTSFPPWPIEFGAVYAIGNPEKKSL